MGLLSRGRKRRLILDIGTSAIRLCELSQTKTGFQLVNYRQREYNSDPALDEEARKELRKKTLQELLKEAKIRTRKAIFAVPGQSVFTRTRTLPPVPEYKVNQIVKYEIQQQIPFGLDQIAMSYQVLSRTEAGGYEVMMAAIKVDVVDKHLEVIESAKRSVDTVDVSPLAAYNWLKNTGEFGDQGECVALIDIGATTTDIVIERDNQFRFTRPLNVGGNDITQAIAASFGMSFQDAEKVKRERGFAPTGDPQRDGKGGEVIGQALQRLVGEIMRSFAYFRSLPVGGPISRVTLTGGGACLRNIIPYLQRQLGVEVRIAQPLAGLAIAPGAQQVSERPEQASVVLGLALRCWQPVTIEINLIPPRVLERVRRKEQVFYWALSLATLALIMASIIPVSANENKIVQGRIETLKQVIGMYDAELIQRIKSGSPVPSSKFKSELGQYQSEVTQLQSNVAALDQARRDRRFWLPEIQMANQSRPSTGGIWFSSIQTTRIFMPGESGAATPTAAGDTSQDDDEDDPRARREQARQERQSSRSRRTAAAGVTTVTSTGFPGVTGDSTRMGGSGSRRGGSALSGIGGGGRDRDNDDGGTASATPARAPGSLSGAFADDDPPVLFPEPNGLIINGFAESDELIKEFIANLKQQERQLPSGLWTRVAHVEFSEADVQKWDKSILYNAPTDLESLAATASTGAYLPTNNVYSFVLHVKFVRSETKGGDPLPDAPVRQAAPAGRTAGTPAAAARPAGATATGPAGAAATGPAGAAATGPAAVGNIQDQMKEGLLNRRNRNAGE
ncbi:MAG: type IV pilus assembly protein PilM [Candidatus Hydrogenedentes bacterium]|nr:type IV pilus assembly protein PilM [Candidatus Hydrogenedentota bacterium]